MRLLRKLGLFHKNQKGITLVELLIALAITGFVTGTTTMVIFQVLDGNARSNNHMLAVNQAQNAGYWLSRDSAMAQTITTDDPDAVLILEWVEWDNTSNDIQYVLDEGELKREEYSDTGQLTSTTLVAEYVESIEVSPQPYTYGMLLTFTITVTIGDGSKEQTETRVYEVNPRPRI